LTDFISPDFKAPCELEIELVLTDFEDYPVYSLGSGLYEESYENIFE